MAKIKIVHWSDAHGEIRKLPDADLYINTGDNNQGFPVRVTPRSLQANAYWGTDKAHEKAKQAEWVTRNPIIIPRKNAPVVMVRGNHDFASFAGQFLDNPVYEIQPDTNPHQMEFELFGLRIGGFRGINYIAGEWCDEFRDSDWTEKSQYWSRHWDVVVTHAPPNGILDKVWNERCGSREYTSYLNKRWYEDENPPKLCCFGHIHECGGQTEVIEGTIFSNAATRVNLVELEIP
jgi:Icc-related predicted phosphoesterase